MALAVFGFSVPVFVVAYLLAYVFALQLEWLPVQGYTPLAEGLWPWLENLILPSIALGCVFIALIARITRATMLEVLQPGLHQHGAGERPRPAGDPVPARAEERLRADRHRHRHRHRAAHRRRGGDGERVRHPGLGRLTIDAILRRDYPVIQGVVLLFSFVYVLVNLAVDLLYTLIDPRIRY